MASKLTENGDTVDTGSGFQVTRHGNGLENGDTVAVNGVAPHATHFAKHRETEIQNVCLYQRVLQQLTLFKLVSYHCRKLRPCQAFHMQTAKDGKLYIAIDIDNIALGL